MGPDLVDAAQEVIAEEPQLAEFRISEVLRDALISLDDVNVETEFRRRANLMRSTKVLGRRVRVSSAGRASNIRRIRGWKLFCCW